MRKCGYNISKCNIPGQNWLLDVSVIAGGDQPEMIFDVGANVGQCLKQIVDVFPAAQVHSFEPFPEVYGKLRQNAMQYDHVHTHNIALGDRDGSQQFFLNHATEVNSLLPVSSTAAQYSPAGWVEPVGSIEVPVQKVDTFCAQSGISHIDLLKIDSQGYELKILKGADEQLRHKRVRFVLLEVLFVSLYDGQPYFEQVYQHLKSFGYRLVDLYDPWREQNSALMWADALFVSEKT
jgi:FkbM family methyltransferase